MTLTSKLISKINAPAPIWWRIVKFIWVTGENIVLSILIFDRPNLENARSIAIYKIISSQLKDGIERFLESNSIEYAPKGASEALKKIADTPTAKEAVAVINETISDKPNLADNEINPTHKKEGESIK
jgi:hypothetical protein